MGSFWNQRGSSIVEFVAISPVLMLVLFGTIVADAAREGARVGAVTPLTGTPPTAFSSAAAVSTINAILAGGHLTAASTPVVTCSLPCAAGATVTATVVVSFQTPIPLLVPLFGASFPLTQSAQMRFE
jgi:Flp pilus assembly protein TadG